MDRLKLSRIDEELDSSEVAALCFLCRDVIQRRRLEGIKDAKDLFYRLEEKCLLDNHFFLSKLLQTINRKDLLNILETDSRPPEENDSCPILSDYRVMLYQIYEELTQENFERMKFLLASVNNDNKLTRRQLEMCNTALDVFAEMEKSGLLSSTNVQELHEILLQLDKQLALMVQQYMEGAPEQLSSHISMDFQRDQNTPTVFTSESQLSDVGQNLFCDAEPTVESPSLSDQTEYYALTHNPRGLCVVINNEVFQGPELKNRAGSQQDVAALRSVFTRLGFTVVVYDNLTAEAMRNKLKHLGTQNFSHHDALVVCVLSHGEKGVVFGTDEKPVLLGYLTQPFTSGRAPTLAGKPKLFFIQACQGNDYQRGSVLYPPRPRQDEGQKESRLEEDAGPVFGETVPSDADFLLGMATVPECKSFRNTSTGSIYIQQLCAQLLRSAESPAEDDILTVLTRVNREVSKGVYLSYKQMPEPKYTLTKKLVLKRV